MILICLLIDYLSNIRKLKRNKIRIVNEYGEEIDIEDVSYKMEAVSSYFRNKNKMM